MAAARRLSTWARRTEQDWRTRWLALMIGDA